MARGSANMGASSPKQHPACDFSNPPRCHSFRRAPCRKGGLSDLPACTVLALDERSRFGTIGGNQSLSIPLEFFLPGAIRNITQQDRFSQVSAVVKVASRSAAGLAGLDPFLMVPCRIGNPAKWQLWFSPIIQKHLAGRIVRQHPSPLSFKQHACTIFLVFADPVRTRISVVPGEVYRWLASPTCKSIVDPQTIGDFVLTLICFLSLTHNRSGSF